MLTQLLTMTTTHKFPSLDVERDVDVFEHAHSAALFANGETEDHGVVGWEAGLPAPHGLADLYIQYYGLLGLSG